MDGVTVTLTDDQLASIEDQLAGDLSAPTGTVVGFEELFGEPFVAGVYATAQGDVTHADNRILCTITDDMVGLKFGMSDRESGAGLKDCVVYIGNKEVSRKSVGAGQCFQFDVGSEHVGECAIDYNFDKDSNMKYNLETYCR